MGHPSDVAGPAGAAADVQPFVRRARLADAEAFATVQHRSWAHGAAQHGLPEPPELDEMVRAWERAITVPPSPRHHSWVAIDRSAAGEVVHGAAATAPSSDPDLDAERCVEVVVLAVDPAARGLGHGSRLVAAAMDAATVDGALEAVAWVGSDDDVTRRFLEAGGWVADGAFRTLTDDSATRDSVGELRQVRLATSLRASDDDLEPSGR